MEWRQREVMLQDTVPRAISGVISITVSPQEGTAKMEPQVALKSGMEREQGVE